MHKPVTRASRPWQLCVLHAYASCNAPDACGNCVCLLHVPVACISRLWQVFVLNAYASCNAPDVCGNCLCLMPDARASFIFQSYVANVCACCMCQLQCFRCLWQLCVPDA